MGAFEIELYSCLIERFELLRDLRDLPESELLKYLVDLLWKSRLHTLKPHIGSVLALIWKDRAGLELA